jgi:hypothetical protein
LLSDIGALIQVMSLDSLYKFLGGESTGRQEIFILPTPFKENFKIPPHAVDLGSLRDGRHYEVAIVVAFHAKQALFDIVC